MKSSFHHSVFTKRRKAVLMKKVNRYTQTITALCKKNDYTSPESVLCIASDTAYQQSIKRVLKSFSGVQQVILIGIGGSSLGTEAVYQALAYKTSPKLLVIDSVDTESLVQLESCINTVSNLRDVVLIVVSKSGTTTETIFNGVKALELCEKKFGKAFSKQVIFIGDNDTDFFKIGKKRKVICIPLPSVISGRFSVFSAVGIVPLTLLGIDIISFCEGAQDALTKKNIQNIQESAVTLALHAENGVHTVNFFTFNKRLELFGHWYRQLLAESIGKQMTTKGTSFQHQLLPIVSTSVDLHSMMQLYLGGYTNIYTHFVYFDEQHPYNLPSAHWLLNTLPFLSGKNVRDVQGAIMQGVLTAYDDQKLPYRVTPLEKCSAYEVGYLLASCMAEVMCLAHILNVNAFDQPSVELYKKHTRVKLSK